MAYAGDLKAATERLAAEAQEGDVVLTLGAGSVWTAGEELLEEAGRMKRRQERRRLSAETAAPAAPPGRWTCR